MTAGPNPALSQGSCARSSQDQQAKVETTSPVSDPSHPNSEESKNSFLPSLEWPTRSLHRRRVFQELFCTFYEQVLHGCNSPTCRTPTCAGYRRRKWRGPFRPYTGLSARALAAHLASEDHPFTKICPCIKVKRTAISDVDVHSTHVQTQKFLGGTCSISGERTQETSHSINKSPKKDPLDPPLLETNFPDSSEPKQDEANTASVKQKPLVTEQEKVKYPTRKNEGVSRDSRSKELLSKDVQKMEEQASKGKDQKSLAQNLFDTATMTMLQLVKVPYILAFPVTPKVASDDESNYVKMKASHATPDSKSCTPVKVVPAKALSKPLRSMDSQRSIENHREMSFPEYINAHNTQNGQNHAKSESGEDFLLNREDFKFLKSTCEFCECKDFRNESVTFCLPMCLINSHCRKLKTETILRPISRSDLVIYEQSGKVSKEAASLTQDLLHEDTSGLKIRLMNMLGRTDGTVPIYQCRKRHKDGPYIITLKSIRSLCDLLRSADFLLKFFVEKCPLGEDAIEVISIGFAKMIKRFNKLHQYDSHPRSIFSALWQSAEFLYPARPSQHLIPSSARKSLELSNKAYTLQSLETSCLFEAAHIAKVILAALVGSIKTSNRNAWLAVQKLRRRGHVALPRLASEPPISPSAVSDALAIIDSFDDDMAHALVKRLTLALACRSISASFSYEWSNEDEKMSHSKSSDITNIIVRALTGFDEPAVIHTSIDGEPTLKSGAPRLHQKKHDFNSRSTIPELKILQLEIVVEWLRGILLREWDGNVEIPACSSVAGALGILSTLYNHYGERYISPEVFETSFIAKRLDVLNTPLAWMNSNNDSGKVHLLEYPFLFHCSTLVSYFRAINHTMMSKAFQDALSNSSLALRLTFTQSETGDRGRLRLEDRLSKLTSSYLVLEIRRQNVLTDALNQLWRRQKRELIRPLKVRLGEDEGEEGVDHGGVQQEFFRLAIAEALEPKYGAFTTDSVTHMSWFRPGSLEPLYKFELLGILTSLAIYNGLTLPFNFPIALYMKLLNHQPDHLEDIVDGWPELSKGLRALGEWADGDVEDIFCRSYVFSMDVFGTIEDVDMLQSATYRKGLQSPEPSMVTNANREQYIQDYIRYLTYSSIEPQYEAFAKGFKTVIDPRSLSLFTPNALQALVQGIPSINTNDLESITSYEGGYDPQHRVVRDFWSIVHSWSSPTSKLDVEAGQLKVRQLLEFVTASDRLPVGGESRVVFVVQKNGVGDDRLPTSLTCFGRLLLPEFSSRQVMEKMLLKAVENAKGFGQP